MKLRIIVRFETDGGQRFFGEGPCRLLLKVEELGSLRAAAQDMDMAYTKARRLVGEAEAALGFPLIRRRTGGKGGGGSALTPQARELTERYRAFCLACGRMAEQLYQEHFDSFLPQARSDQAPFGHG